MRRKKKNNYLIAILLLLLVGMGIGYAGLSTTLNISGKSTISKATWSVYFDNVQEKYGSVEAQLEPTIADDTVIVFEVGLALPGDFYEFTFDVINDGTIDAMIDDVNILPQLTAAQSKYLNYTVTYQNGDEIKANDLIAVDSSVSLKVRVEFRNDINASDLPTEEQDLELEVIMNYVQADDTAVAVRNDGLPEEITFMFLDNYTALEGMTWADFIGSEYNKDENGNDLFWYGTINGDPVVVNGPVGTYVIYQEGYDTGQLNFVYPGDLIIPDYEYYQFAI